MADLRFNIESGMLTGNIGKNHIIAKAYSGGRGGSKTKGAVNPWLVNNALATGIGGPHSRIFGPLPMGLYHLRVHENKPHMLRLLPVDPKTQEHRSGFLIHGRGKIGSHGCIVPEDFNIVLFLCKLVKENDDAKRPLIELEVFAEGTEIGKRLNMA